MADDLSSVWDAISRINSNVDRLADRVERASLQERPSYTDSDFVTLQGRVTAVESGLTSLSGVVAGLSSVYAPLSHGHPYSAITGTHGSSAHDASNAVSYSQVSGTHGTAAHVASSAVVWSQIGSIPASNALDWAQIGGKPTEFTPASHSSGKHDSSVATESEVANMRNVYNTHTHAYDDQDTQYSFTPPSTLDANSSTIPRTSHGPSATM